MTYVYAMNKLNALGLPVIKPKRGYHLGLGEWRFNGLFGQQRRCAPHPRAELGVGQKAFMWGRKVSSE